MAFLPRIIPEYDKSGYFSTLPLVIPQAIDARVKMALEIAQRLLPIAVVYRPNYTFPGAALINCVTTYFDKGTYWEKGFSWCANGVTLVSPLVTWAIGAILANTVYTGKNLWNLKNAAFAKDKWATVDPLLNVADIALYWAPGFKISQSIGNSRRINFLVYQAVHHAYNAYRVFPKVTSLKSLDTLELGVQVAMIGVRLAQAYRFYQRSRLTKH